jgi:phage-related protein
MDLLPKPVEWIASSLDDLKDFPEDVQQAVGYALYLAQCSENTQVSSHLRASKEHRFWKCSRL